jgi:prevent-host-death family protein
VAKIINMHDAKTQLSRLVEQAEAGEDIVLARAGKPVVRLVPVRVARRRKLGQWNGKVRISKDFDAPLPDDLQRAWEGRRNRA